MPRRPGSCHASKVPVFYLKDDSGGVHVEGGEGLFFMSPEDAQAKLGELKNGGASKVQRDWGGRGKGGQGEARETAIRDPPPPLPLST